MIERISHRGWNDVWRLSNGTVELMVLADAGPRVLRYSFCGGENILHEVPSDGGKTGGNEFRLYGGHRLWAWPEIARTYFPDNRPVEVTRTANGLYFTSPVEEAAPGTGLHKQVAVLLEESGTRVALEHKITNCGKLPTELSVWCPTMMRVGGKAILPLPPRIAMDVEHYQSVGPMTLWSFTDLADPRWTFGTEFIQLQQQRHAGKFSEQMTGVFNPAGWGAFYSRGLLFVKRASPAVAAKYPDFGCNFEIFTNPEFLELETLSPVVELQPGESATHSEAWALFEKVAPGVDDAWISEEVVPRATSVSPG